MNKKTIMDVDVKGKKVLLRCDFNVPIKNGVITDDSRIKASVPTIKYLLANGARVIICSHFGRPKGKSCPDYSFAPLAAYLSGYIGELQFCDDIMGEGAKQKAADLEDGQALFLENLRFYPGEEANDPEFARALASLCDIYVNDAFGVSHRAHASVAGVTKFAPVSVAGFLLKKETDFLGQKLANEVERPYVAIVGGSKVSDKIAVIKNLIKKADSVIIGGGMAFTFLAAMGFEVGRSLVEKDKKHIALNIIKQAQDNGARILLPVDVRVAKSFPDPIDLPMDFSVIRFNAGFGFPSADCSLYEIDNFTPDEMGLDIGPETEKLFAGVIERAKTILWNGPMGVFENPTFIQGTKAVATAIARAASNGALSVVGGGDSAAAAITCGVADVITHISTGGGASLEFLEGKPLPGVEALNDK